MRFVFVALRVPFDSILRRLIAVTDRTCDRGKDRVSPLYLATDQRECTQVLLEEGFHPDAQDCSSFIAQSPLAKALAPLHASSRTPRYLEPSTVWYAPTLSLAVPFFMYLTFYSLALSRSQ